MISIIIFINPTAKQKRSMMINFISLKTILLDLGLITRKKILDIQKHGLKVQQKSDASLVTNADIECESIILKTLEKVYPNIPIISEELVSNKIIPDYQDYFFCVDPIDGTHNYIKQKSSFTINIALIHKTIPIAGMICAPALNKIYYGDLKQGASLYFIKNHNLDKKHQLNVRKPDQNNLEAVVSLFRKSSQLTTYLKKLGVKKITPVGSSLKFCLLAEGKADIYARLDSIMEWDIAAGDAILRAAGGITLEMNHSPIHYGIYNPNFKTPGFIAKAREPSIHLNDVQI